MSLLWKTSRLTEEQHAALAQVDALPGEPGRENMASGAPVKALMAKHHIIVHKHSPFDDEIQPQYGGSASHAPDDELHTRQEHLWKPALKHYIEHGHESMCDHDYEPDHYECTGPGDEEHVPYRPQTYSHGDKDWIDEGHHRILAERMLGNHVDTEHGDTYEHDDDRWDED